MLSAHVSALHVCVFVCMCVCVRVCVCVCARARARARACSTSASAQLLATIAPQTAVMKHQVPANVLGCVYVSVFVCVCLYVCLLFVQVCT